jgi:hypothetical protein
MRLLLVALAALLLLLPARAMAASQIAPVDGLWLSLPPDMVKCILIRLPDDAGITQPGNYIFTVSCTPGPQESWADLSEQIVYEIHEGNTAEIPICFDKHAGKPLGNCSSPYTITVSEAFTGALREWHGGICVSERPDVDIRPGESPASGGDVMEILNDNADIFSAWLDEEELYAGPGEEATFNLSVQSQAGLDMTVLTQSGLEVSPGQASLHTVPGGLQYRAFGLTAPDSPGTYTLSLRVSPDACQDTHCTRFLEGRLVVSEDGPPGETGFEVRLRPESLDIKEPGRVIMRLSIINNDDEMGSFTSSINTDPSDGSSDFTGETSEIGPHRSHTKTFIFTPGGSSRLYEVTARVESRGIVQSATSFITIDELAADALRQAEGLGPDARAEVSSWVASHDDSEYGSDLQEYGSLRESLAQARESQGQPQPPANQSIQPGGGQEQPEPPGMPWVVLPAAAIAAAALAAFVLLRRRSGNREPETEYY